MYVGMWDQKGFNCSAVELHGKVYQHKAVIVNRGAQTVEEAIEMASAATQSEERHRLATDRPPLREYVGNF